MMIRFYLILCLILSIQFGYSQHDSKTFKTEIKSATVYIKSAAIQRSGSIALSSGKYNLSIQGLSPYIKAKSIKVKGTGAITVLGVDHRLNYLDKLSRSIVLLPLEEVMNQLIKENEIAKARLDILSEKKALLTANRKIGTIEKGVSVEEFQATMDFYEEQLEQISQETIDIRYAKSDNEQRVRDIQVQIKSIKEEKQLPTGEITIKVQADQSTSAQLDITYLVGNAGWYPKYDVRVDDIDQPLKVIYKAHVFQHTGNRPATAS